MLCWQLQHTARWVSAAEVKHPLLDKVRACSVNPEQAADFFLLALHPIDTWRLTTDAAHHPYLNPMYVKMLDEFPLPESHPYRRKKSTSQHTVLQSGGPFVLCCEMVLHHCCVLKRRSIFSAQRFSAPYSWEGPLLDVRVLIPYAMQGCQSQAACQSNIKYSVPKQTRLS